ncbi:hypothetical protein EYC84_008129 [Monilinia fructicola]|uniref:Uncharacterized protein n=1 Tax=Monilinia fructicola TaxID=38448 RepID=A0A5M9JIU5_MONFR|nr:hypothetical protein EYC84_008129 [Monilinia fructicola]
MASEPTTPVRVSKSAANYTPTTQDPDLRSQINALLLKDGHVAKIQETLLHALHSSPTKLANPNPNPRPRPPALRKLHDVPRAHRQSARGHTSRYPGPPKLGVLSPPTSSANGVNGVTDKDKKGEGKDASPKGRGERGQSLALPKSVVEEGVRITRESLDAVCEVVE